MKRLIHIYTGDGKGKTTAAIGLGIRAYGAGMNILMVQFLKGMHSSEIDTLELLKEHFEIRRSAELKKFVRDMTEKEKEACRIDMIALFRGATEDIIGEKKDFVILDEIMGAISTGMIAVADVLYLLEQKPDSVEIVLTGRNAPMELIERADYVMDIKSIKHPYDKGVTARKGIEF